MGLIREALRVPLLDGDEADADAFVMRLVDGSAIGVDAPYEMISKLVFGQRPLTGTPRGVRLDDKRGWLALSPPACAPEDEGVFPLTAIVSITPLFLAGGDEAEGSDAFGEHLTDAEMIQGAVPRYEGNGNGNGDGTPESPGGSGQS